MIDFLYNDDLCNPLIILTNKKNKLIKKFN